jgi:hypothetical protein
MARHGLHRRFDDVATFSMDPTEAYLSAGTDRREEAVPSRIVARRVPRIATGTPWWYHALRRQAKLCRFHRGFFNTSPALFGRASKNNDLAALALPKPANKAALALPNRLTRRRWADIGREGDQHCSGHRGLLCLAKLSASTVVSSVIMQPGDIKGSDGLHHNSSSRPRLMTRSSSLEASRSPISRR